MSYLFILIAVALMAVDFIFKKFYQDKAGVAPAACLFFNAVVGFFQGIIYFVVNGVQNVRNTEQDLAFWDVKFTWFAIAMAAGMAICVFMYNIIGFKMMAKGSLATYTMFLMTGGMLIPFVVGLVAWGEFDGIRSLTLSDGILSLALSVDGIISLVLSIVGLVIMIAGVIVQNYTGKKEPGSEKAKDNSLVLLGIIVFVLNGLVGVFSKTHQYKGTPDAWKTTTEAFVMFSGFFMCIFCSIALVATAKKNKAELKAIPVKKVLPVIFCCAAASGTSYLFQLLVAEGFNATLQYPLQTGGCIVFTALGGWLFFKEKPSKPLIIGIILCIIGTLFFIRF